MRSLKKILIFENRRRLKFLNEFRNQFNSYIENSEGSWKAETRIESEIAKANRIELNKMMEEVELIVDYSGVNTNYTLYPAPAVGGYVKRVAILSNIFNLFRLQMSPDVVLDCIDRSIGNYERNIVPSIVRMINPFFLIFLVLSKIVNIPFSLISTVGFDRYKFEESIFGKGIKFVLYLLTGISSFLVILQLLGLLDWFNAIIRTLLIFE